MARFRPIQLLKGAVAMALTLLSCAHAGEAAAEYTAKAAFIYNIALFSSFPNTGSVVRLCVLGRDPFGSVLSALEGKALGQARIALAYPRSGSDAARQCQIVFISESEAGNLGPLAEACRESGVLTIADIKGAARKGVMLELTIEDKRITFEFNATAAHAANIALSSKVLRLARAVH
jgi:hypothetical protein